MPVPFAPLKVADGQHIPFVPPKRAGEQKGQKRPVTFAFHLPVVGHLQ